MGHTQSAQHSFHHQHQHHRAYRPHGPSPGGSAGDGSSEADDVPRWNTHSFPRDPRRARALRHGQPGHTQLAPENKVLPKVIGPPPKLRSTDNGNILHNGGTISGRKISQTQLVAPVKAYRARHDPIVNGRGSGPGLSSSRGRFGGSEPDLRAPGQHRTPQPSNNNNVREQPNNRPSRTTTAAAAAAAAAARKKYKAPPPPQGGVPQDSESPSDTTWEEGGSAIPRRARLFKTRTQTNGSPAPPTGSCTSGGRTGRTSSSREEENVSRTPLNPAAANFLAQKSVSSPEFQHELVRAAQRRHRERVAKQQSQQQQQQKVQQQSTPPSQPQKGSSPVPAGPRHAPVGRESSGEHKETERRSTRSRSPVSDSGLKRTPKHTPVVTSSPAAPPKTFYFGMEMSSGAADEDEVDRFAARLRRPDRHSARPSSGSGGSFFEEEQLQNEGNISLQLRPTLPKKTPDIPRFSPTAAWRQLLVGGDSLSRDAGEDSEEEVNGHRGRHRHRSSSPILRESSGTTALLEERIVQSYLQRAPLVVAARGSVATQEKSGDSGISGDASPGPGATLLDSPDPAPLPHPRARKHHHAAVAAVRQWTPEQDLDETSSEDEHTRPPPARSPQTRRAISEERPGETAFKGERGRSSGRVTPPKFIRRSHMFSLSLPRPDHLQYVATKGYDDLESPLESPTGPENVTAFHSLKKLRRSVSGALGAALGGSNNLRAQQMSLDENWYLSRSAPNSLDSSGEGGGIWGPRALRHMPDENGELPSSPDCDGEDEAEDDEELSSGLKTPAFSYLASGGHIMYLPEYDSRRCIVPRVKSNQLTAAQRSLSVDVLNFHKKQEINSNFTVLKYQNDEIQEMKEKRPESPWSDTQHHQQIYQSQKSSIPIALASKSTPVSSKKGKKFTFQSTIRQIERRRIADRLSKEAEQQERQRKQEAEAMRLVEEEFQRKRAREKASLKEQLRLFSLQDGADGPHSLPVMSSDPEPRVPQRRTRAEPEGAAARVVGVQNKRSGYKQDHEDEVIRARAEPREYRDYTASPAKINSRYPSGERSTPPPSSPSSGRGSNNGARRNVLHPPAVYDMPKNTQVYVASHPTITVPGPIFVDSEAPGGVPRSPDQHNYRREFARGAVPGGGMSPKSSPRVPRAKLSPSPSPLEQDSGASRGHSQYNSNNFSSLPPQQLVTSSTPAPQLTRLSALQPFGMTRAKGYRPIAFKPAGGAAGSGNKGAKLAQAVS